MSGVHLKAKVGFASVLSAVVFVATGHGVALPRADAAVERICAVGGKEEFRTFLRMAAGEGAELECFGEVESLPLATASNTLFVVAPRYARGEVVCRRLGDRMVAEMEAALRRGNRFYFENVPSESMAERRFLGVTMLGAKPAPFERRILETDVGLLQFRAGGYMPGALYMSGPVKMRAKVVASVSDALGVNAVFLPAQERGPAVAASADGRRIFSFVRLSACDARTVRPYARWRAFYARRFAALLGRDEASVSAAFAKAWPALLADSGMRTPDEVVKKAIAWHENSGVLFSPDGAKGMREAVSSDGFGWRGALRVDCNMMTGALFAWAGRIYGRPDWTRIGRNLADHILARGCQTEEGYFRWFDKDADGGASVFATDHGRSTLAAINLYCATRDERYLAVARRAADAFMAWQADDGLVTIWFDLRRGPAPKKGHSENPVCYYENIPALFRMADWRSAHASTCSSDQSETACGSFRNIPSPEHGASTSTASNCFFRRGQSLSGRMEVMTALRTPRRSSVLSSTAARFGLISFARRTPRFFKPAASCPDLPPGAAQRSRTVSPGETFSMDAGYCADASCM